MNQQSPIKSTLKTMQIGSNVAFPLSKRHSVRSTTSSMRLDGFLFTTEMQVEEKLIVVTRKK